MSGKRITVTEALDVLNREFEKNPSLRGAYQSNIAVAFIDEALRHKKESGNYLSNKDIYKIANEAADTFLTSLT